MIDNTVYYKKYCSVCNTELDFNNDYCYICRKHVSSYVVPNIDYDKRLWSEKDLKEFIEKTIKELEEKRAGNNRKEINKWQISIFMK